MDSERRTVLRAVHVAVRAAKLELPAAPEAPAPAPENAPPEGNGPAGVPLCRDLGRRISIIMELAKPRSRIPLVLARLRQVPDPRAEEMVAVMEALRDRRLEDVRRLLCALGRAEFERLVRLWLQAERDLGRDVVRVLERVTQNVVALREEARREQEPRPREPVRVDQPPEQQRVHHDGSLIRTIVSAFRAAGAPARAARPPAVQVEIPAMPRSRPLRVERLADEAQRLDPPRALEALKYLFGFRRRWEIDADRVVAAYQSKSLAITAMLDAARIEPVGYLHLEKLVYEPLGPVLGELVQSVPLVPGETRRFTHTQWSITRSEYSKLVTEMAEKSAEQSLAETSELMQAARSEASREFGLAVATNVSGTYGTVNFSVSGNLNYSTSETQSRENSSRSAREITEKASSRSKEERKVEFKFQTEEGVTDVAYQEVTNSTPNPVTWAYHRIMTRWRIALYRYGVRLTYDLVIPDPAHGFLRDYIRLNALKALLSQDDSFSVTPDQITVENYGDLAAQYGGSIEAPPPAEIWVAATAVHNATATDRATDRTATLQLQIPTGYVFTGEATAWVQSVVYGGLGPSADSDLYAYEAQNRAKMAGVAERYDWTYSYWWNWPATNGRASITVRAQAARTDDAETQWRLRAWERLHDAHMATRERRRIEWRRETEEIQARLGTADALTLRQREREEITRAALAWLLGPQFQFEPPGSTGTDPATEFDPAMYSEEGTLKPGAEATFLPHADAIRFIHQAIEWENMLYSIYPYFWTDSDKWETKRGLQHPEFAHQTFLRSGAARVVLTIRPGFEDAFLSFVETLQVPGPNVAPHPYQAITSDLRARADTSYPFVPSADPIIGARPLLTAKQRKAWEDIQVLVTLVERYRAANAGALPPDIGAALDAHLGNGVAARPAVDPWGNAYVFTVPGAIFPYEIASLGADGAVGGDDENADISTAAPCSLIDVWHEHTPSPGLHVIPLALLA